MIKNEFTFHSHNTIECFMGALVCAAITGGIAGGVVGSHFDNTVAGFAVFSAPLIVAAIGYAVCAWWHGRQPIKDRYYATIERWCGYHPELGRFVEQCGLKGFISNADGCLLWKWKESIERHDSEVRMAKTRRESIASMSHRTRSAGAA